MRSQCGFRQKLVRWMNQVRSLDGRNSMTATDESDEGGFDEIVMDAMNLSPCHRCTVARCLVTQAAGSFDHCQRCQRKTQDAED